MYTHGYDFLFTWAALASLACTRGQALYSMDPKHHHVCHLLDAVKAWKYNPRFEHLFGAKDFVGRIKQITCKTHRSSAPLRTLERYLLLLGELWGC